MREFRVEFQNGQIFDFVVAPAHLFGGANPMVSLIVYRVIDGRRDRTPLRRVDGTRLEFTAATDEAACTLGCEVLQWIHNTTVRRIGTPPPSALGVLAG